MSMPDPVLRLVEGGALGRYLPGWATLEFGGDLGQQLVISLTVPTDGPLVDLVDDGAIVAVTLNGVEVPDGRFLIDETEDEEVVTQDVVTRQGNSLLFGLDYAIVYPASDPTAGVNTTTPGTGFASQTPGNALRVLLEAAQARGWWPGLDWDFTDSTDSGGNAWSANVNEFYDMGTSLLDVVAKWTTRQIAVARMTGETLQLFRYDASGPDKSASIHLFRDVDLTEGPVRRSSRNTVSAMLVTTDGQGSTAGFGVTRTDAPALSKYGRREGFVSQSGVTDATILQSVGDGTLALKARQREAFTYGLTAATPGRLPFVDLDRGTQVTLRVRADEHRVMRVRQLSMRWEQDGSCSGAAAFGDRQMDTEDQLAQRLEQLSGGSMDGGAFGQPVVGGQTVPPASGGGGGGADTMPPAPPTGLGASTVSVFELGYLSATATFAWTAPTTNQNGTSLEDLGDYQLQYRTNGTTEIWTTLPTIGKDETTTVVRRLVVGKVYDWRIRAFDQWGNASSWATSTFTAVNDTVAPTQTPATPTVSTFLFGGLLVTWDGKAAGGTAIDNDTRQVEVHLSTVNNFAPSSGTLKDTIGAGGGATVVGELTPGTTYYVKFRSVDWAGNIGPSSAQATGVPDSVQTGDIANGAVTDAKIGTLSVTKLTAGTMSAVVTLSGEFQTAATGKRVVSNASGIKLYDATNNVVVNLDTATGQGTFNGVLGAMTLSGYIYVTNGIASVIIRNFSSLPAMSLSTGLLIEKYPSYMFAQADSFLRKLQLKLGAPGTAYIASDSSTYDYPYILMDTNPYDGDFANATSMPTAVWGRITLALPCGNLANISRVPNVSIWSRWNGSTDPATYHLAPAVVWTNGASDQHRAGIRIDGLGAGQDNCQLAVVKHDGGSWATLAAVIVNKSGEAVKTEIGEVPYSALDVIRASPAKRWRYRQDPAEPKYYAIGPMGDDLPIELRQVNDDDPDDVMVMQHSMIGLLWKAVEELHERLEQLEAA
jgi:hypothetical protein